MLVALIISTLALVASAVAERPRWQEIGIATDGTRAFVELSSLSLSAGLVRARQRFVVARPVAGGPHRVEQDVTYDCASRKVRTLRHVEYDREGRLIRNHGPEGLDTYEIEPGTLPEYIADAIC